jgi:hypothetical protein
MPERGSRADGENGRVVDAYPLAWPAGWPRTAAADRVRAKFHSSSRVQSSYNPGHSYAQKKDLSIFDATRRVQAELERLGVLEADIVISTNMELRRDGLPRSDRRAPDDPGVAVYWTDPDTGESQCMAIDLYTTVAGNLAAVAATIDAMRAIERHGGAQILKRAFQGFTALAASTTTAFNVDQAAALFARLSGQDAAAMRVLETHFGSSL